MDKVIDEANDATEIDYPKYNDIKTGQGNENFKYDSIGNLISDASEGITDIQWNVYGKIRSITKAGANIEYTYDASGNRICKTANGKSTYYVRDASGNVMSIYEQADTLKQTELHMYACLALCGRSSRLGICKNY